MFKQESALIGTGRLPRRLLSVQSKIASCLATIIFNRVITFKMTFILPTLNNLLQIHHVLQDTDYGIQTMTQALSTILPGIDG